MREIVFDTETTGVNPASGDRIVEIGGIELLNHIPTGRSFHVYVNPERSMPKEAFDVHGLSDEFLADKKVFAAVADELADFFGDAKLVAHNAMFDLGFVNAEFARTGHAAIQPGRIIDTLALARRKHPGASNSLDALCSRYGIDTSRRVKHGALLDSELLAEVYIELIGGKQTMLGLTIRPSLARAIGTGAAAPVVRAERIVRSHLSDAEREAHAAFVATLGEKAIWRRYLGSGEAP
ncbi:DNA polymerase III subunit epsilon [Enterovirga rhinocerotis]|uniref:DNA polymerase III subunit epsilon n=1 Tax=Enterovirga rhinocerotis TaxID=1339210 RepID=A0A4R7BSV5_9HYPH|nr:DNA polymerase III subunit epsilon [Enterovirga rhinocerotis]TDR87177.1 DNA polymerase-3 subunit epsilon [Enterovirga rhinocerotis]